MSQCRIRSGRCFALIAAAGLALSWGCEREDAAGDALNSAHVKLTSLSPYGTTVPAGDYKLKTYREIIDTLKAAESGTDTQKASASLLIAQAQIGLTEPTATRAGQLERSTLDSLSSVRLALGHYINSVQSADAAASYDPAKDIAEIEKQDKEKAGQITSEQAAKAAIEKQAADLQAQAKAKADEARAKRQEGGSLRQKVAGQSAVEGEKTLAQWQKLSREADALDSEGARLDAEAFKVAPRAADVQNSIDRLTKQRELLAAERTEVGRRTQAAKERAAELRAEAAKTAEEIRKMVDDIHALRTGELAEASQKAAADFDKAAQTAKAAVKELKGSAQMVVGAAKQALGETLLSRGRGLKVYANVLDSLGATDIPGADGYKSKAAEARTASKEAFDQAFEAYQAADAAYNGAGATGEAKARLERLNAKFIELIEASGGSRDLISARGQPAEEVPAPDAAPAAAAASGDQATPQGTLQMLIDIEKSGNYASMADLFLTNSDAERQAMAQVVSVAPKFKKFDNAVKGKFGKSFTDIAKEMAGAAGAAMPSAGSMAGPDLEGLTSAADVPVKVEGDTATFTLPNNEPLIMKQHDGKWLVDISAQSAQFTMMAPMMAPLGKAVEELTADVEAGKFATTQDMMMAFGQKLQSMMGMNPGGG